MRSHGRRNEVIRPHYLRALLAAALVAILVPTAAADAATRLDGTFRFTPGKYKASTKKASGTYFRMIYPNGKPGRGPFFKNSDSTAKDKTYTLLRPGGEGGLITGAFQQPPDPAFGSNGDALANRIIPPTLFAGIRFSLSTAPTDAQSGASVGPPAVSVSGTKLSGDLRGFTASWNSIWFNQGSPKPAGNRPGLTRAVRGSYDPKTRRYTLTWISQIVGGPFHDFSGYWHLQGRFEPRG